MAIDNVNPVDRYDAYRADRPDALTWLQGWFAAHCDGDWEHDRGITIENLDNPGWSVRIELAGTELHNVPFQRYEHHRSEDDWLVLWVDATSWNARCGPLNLGEALHQFRAWSGDIRAR